MEKIVQISFQIPPRSYSNLTAYAKHVLADIYQGQEISYLDLVYATVGNNPRKIKRLCRGLEVAYEMMEISVSQVITSESSDNDIRNHPATSTKIGKTKNNVKNKSYEIRKKEFAKIYCLQYGWPEVSALLEKVIKHERNNSKSIQNHKKTKTNSSIKK